MTAPRPLAEALKDLAGFGFVHWVIYPQDVFVDAEERSLTEVNTALLLFVETGWGLRLDEARRETGDTDDVVYDALTANPLWTYRGSGGFFTPITEVYPYTTDAWAYPGG